ncbi:unnamed protein product [Pleuronectes platessa]|uniref:Uncharacterized protein n=1 Tax=Pleuronectes platessa TaxID=8262 RepID=A0A9N7V9T4_PLEPL|nr:unnamed protein product [Pleuronectes platessa]
MTHISEEPCVDETRVRNQQQEEEPPASGLRRAAISASSVRISDDSARASGQTPFLPPAAVAGRLLQRASRIDL